MVKVLARNPTGINPFLFMVRISTTIAKIFEIRARNKNSSCYLAKPAAAAEKNESPNAGKKATR
jgi:hypothetical protein